MLYEVITQIAANASDKMVVVDTQTQKLEALIDTDKKPHPGPGANWIDPKCGPVGATTHLGVGKVTVWGNDPAGHKDQAWKICYEVQTRITSYNVCYTKLLRTR